MNKRWVAICVFVIWQNAWGVGESGTGTVLVADHLFSFTAPKGWIMDDRSGVAQGLYVVFYPVGQSWRDSPVMAYMRTYGKSDAIATIPQLVDNTIRVNGSPDYRVAFLQAIELGPDRKAMIYHYSGDRRGTHEAIAYIEEQNSFNCLVLSARDRKEFDDSWEKFDEMVKSYSFTPRTQAPRPGAAE